MVVEGLNGLGVAVDRLNAVGRATALFTEAVVAPSVTVTAFAAGPAMRTSVRVRVTAVIARDRYRQQEGRTRGDSESRSRHHAVSHQPVHAVCGMMLPDKAVTGLHGPADHHGGRIVGERHLQARYHAGTLDDYRHQLSSIGTYTGITQTYCNGTGRGSYRLGIRRYAEDRS